MHIAFISSDYVGAKAYDRDTALIGAFQGLSLEVSVVVPALASDLKVERWRSALLRRLGYKVATCYDGPRLRRFARSIETALVETKAEVIFSRSPRFSAWLNTPLPVVNWFDAAFVSLVDFYPEFTHLDALSRWAGHRAASRALQRADLTLFMSFWAAAKAIRRYHADSSRLGIVPAAAILRSEPRRSEVLAARSGARGLLRCLVVGNNWARKGADIAVEAVRRVRGKGVAVHLTTLGMKAPSELPCEPWLDVLPALQKGQSDEYAKFCEAFLAGDVLLLPSRADFSPHVIPEAYAFGLPVMGSPVGAIPEMIEHGQSGFVARRVDDADEYAQFLCRLATEPGLLPHMAVESRNKYEAEFALPVVARKLLSYMAAVCHATKGDTK